MNSRIKINNIVILIFAGLAFSSCDLFSTRDAENPTQPRSNLPQPFRIEELIDNFVFSNVHKSLNDYINCFSDTLFSDKSYSFIPSSESASQYPALNEWNLKSEENFFRNLISESKDVSISLNLTNSNFSQQGDSLIYTASYNFTIPFSNSGIPQNYGGDLIFHILHDNNQVLRIYFWQDFKNGDFPSWSELKGRLAN